jgi:hypothetical protein
MINDSQQPKATPSIGNTKNVEELLQHRSLKNTQAYHGFFFSEKVRLMSQQCLQQANWYNQ